jgi:hypothetical protein
LEPNRRHNRAQDAIRDGNLADVVEKSATGNDSSLLAIQRNPNLWVSNGDSPLLARDRMFT